MFLISITGKFVGHISECDSLMSVWDSRFNKDVSQNCILLVGYVLLFWYLPIGLNEQNIKAVW